MIIIPSMDVLLILLFCRCHCSRVGLWDGRGCCCWPCQHTASYCRPAAAGPVAVHDSWQYWLHVDAVVDAAARCSAVNKGTGGLPRTPPVYSTSRSIMMTGLIYMYRELVCYLNSIHSWLAFLAAEPATFCRLCSVDVCFEICSLVVYVEVSWLFCDR